MRVIEIHTILLVDSGANYDSDFITEKHLQRNDTHEGITSVLHHSGEFSSLGEWSVHRAGLET